MVTFCLLSSSHNHCLGGRSLQDELKHMAPIGLHVPSVVQGPAEAAAPHAMDQYPVSLKCHTEGQGCRSSSEMDTGKQRMKKGVLYRSGN